MFGQIADSIEQHVIEIQNEIRSMDARLNELREVRDAAEDADGEADLQVYDEIAEIENKQDDLDWQAWDAGKIARTFRYLQVSGVTADQPAKIVEAFIDGRPSDEE